MKYTVFADTFYWIALTAPRDLHSQDAVRFDNLFSEGAVFTTQEVLSELLAFFSGNARLRNRAVATVRHIMSDPSVRVIPQSNESFMSGLELYAARPDKAYSLTDCISMQTMRREGLTDCLTNDVHFEQEGFRALFRSRDT